MCRYVIYRLCQLALAGDKVTTHPDKVRLDGKKGKENIGQKFSCDCRIWGTLLQSIILLSADDIFNNNVHKGVLNLL